MKIGELARHLDVATSKIRFLESRGIVRARRLASGYREYSEEEVETLEIVLQAQSCGFSLEEVASALNAAPGRKLDCAAMIPRLAERLEAIDRHLAQTKALRRRVNEMKVTLERRLAAR